MSPTFSDWLIFALGMIGLVLAVWLHRKQSQRRRAENAVGPGALGKLGITLGFIMALDGFVEFNARTAWRAMILGFTLGGVLGVLFARAWVSRRVLDGEGAGRPRSAISRMVHSWRVQVLLIALLLLIGPPLFSRLDFAFAYVNPWAGASQVLAGFFLVFGLWILRARRTT
jgi:membrane associated rhomboid family serine protease